MALLFLDSFDSYSNAQFSRRWTLNDGGPSIASTGRNGTQAMNLPGNFTFVTQPLPTNVTTLIVGGAFKFTSGLGNNVGFILFSDNTTNQITLTYNIGDASLTVGCPSGNFTSAAGVVPSATSQFNYIEFKATINDTTGSFEVRVNENTVISQTNKDTKTTANAYVTAVVLSCAGGGGQNIVVDDFYMLDNTGPTHNDFLGDIRIQCLYPNGAGSITNFTPSTGSNYQCVDETTSNDDTDYVSSNVVGHSDLYTFQDLAAATTNVLAVAVTSTDRKDDGGTRTHAHIIYSGSLVSGATFSPSTAYGIHQTIFPTAPNGSAWNITTVNNLEAGHSIAS